MRFTIGTLLFPALAALVQAQTQATCDSGSLLCCASTADGSDTSVATILGILGTTPEPGTTYGQDCVDVNPGSGTCTEEIVCCQSNPYHGIVAVGCAGARSSG